MNAIAAMDKDFAETLDAELTTNVIKLRPNPEDDIERLANYHRQGERKYRQRIADTRRARKLKDALINADEKAEIARHKAQMELYAEQRANNKELSERAIAADEKLAAYNKSAVANLEAE